MNVDTYVMLEHFFFMIRSNGRIQVHKEAWTSFWRQILYCILIQFKAGNLGNFIKCIQGGFVSVCVVKYLLSHLKSLPERMKLFTLFRFQIDSTKDFYTHPILIKPIENQTQSGSTETESHIMFVDNIN